MARKVRVHTINLYHDPIEILGHNPKRIEAQIWGDNWVTNGALSLGESGQQCASGAVVQIVYAPLVWYGINPLFACASAVTGEPQAFTILELVEE